MILPNCILHGDAYKLIKDVPDKSIDLIIVDPPYEFVKGGGAGAFGVRNRPYHEKTALSDTMNCGIESRLLKDFERVSKKTNIYIFCNKYQILQYLEFYRDKTCDILVWEKTNVTPVINVSYLPNLEYIIFVREKGAYFDATYERASKIYTSSTNKKDKALYEHPTPKPEDLIERFILNSSQENDVVLDCFLGSGTTAAMAKKNNRRYIGFDLDENYVRIAKDRLNGITSFDRKIQETGQIDLFDIIEDIAPEKERK
jgi:DNA modification methylase